MKTVSDMFAKRKINLIIFDSSKDDKTYQVVQKYRKRGYKQIKYDRYCGEYDGVSIDQKVIDAYTKYADEYEYLWVTRDGIIICLELVINDLYRFMNQHVQMIVVDDSFRDYKLVGSKVYNDVTLLFKERCMQMTVLGATIVRSDVIKEIITNINLDEHKNYGMWQPIAFFEYFSDKTISIGNYVGPLFMPNLSAKPSSFWHNRLLWQWGERWYTMISELPDIYNPYKDEVLKDEMVDFHPFSTYFLVRCRENGGITFSNVKKYKEYIPYVCNTPIWKFYCISFIPKWLVRFTFMKEGYLRKIMRQIFRMTLK